MKIISLISIFCVLSFTAWSQEVVDSTAAEAVVTEEVTEEVPTSTKDRPVSDVFASGYLLDQQSTTVMAPKTLEMVIQHRFGTINNGVTDLWGVYAPSQDIRMGLNYVVINHLQVGIGVSKLYMTTDFNVKYAILEQTRKNRIPVSVAVYGNMAIDGSDSKKYGLDYEVSDRFSYHGILLVSRKFSDWASVQMGLSMSHYNVMDTLVEHDKIGLHLGGRLHFSPQGSFVFNYDQPLNNLYREYRVEDSKNVPLPNFSFGFEIGTSTHAFQIMMGTSAGLLPQEVIMKNQHDITKGEIALGFVITRLWSF